MMEAHTPNFSLEDLRSFAQTEFGGKKLYEIVKEGKRSFTTEIKKKFMSFGRGHNLKVGCFGVDGADCGEWLFDMILYVEDEQKRLKRVVAVIESELGIGLNQARSGYGDSDFDKLLVARADHRIWISVLHTASLAEEHIANCKKQLRSFQQSLEGDCFLFIVSDWTSCESRIESFVRTAV